MKMLKKFLSKKLIEIYRNFHSI